VDASAPLLYGNAGKEITAAFAAHISEQTASVGTDEETRHNRYYEDIIRRIDEFGSLILENIASFSFLVNPKEERVIFMAVHKVGKPPPSAAVQRFPKGPEG
jgi:hypothetical protein